MKKLFILFVVFLIVFSTFPQYSFAIQYTSEQNKRIKTNINQDWKFKLGDYSGAQNTTYDDSSWSNIGLPHSFGIPYFMESSWYVGYGWYRKHLNIEPSWEARRISIEFEAAFQSSEIYINNKLVSTHKGGYTGFSVDITDYVHRGDNILAVRLNNYWDAEIAPRAGEHNFNGGIYRNVYLVVTDPLHVTWYGTFATTPNISDSSANVNMKTEIKNDSKTTQNCSVKTTIVDDKNNVVTSMESSNNISAGATYTFDQTSEAISKPHLWSPEDPYLYTAYTSVYSNGVLVDDYSTTFGMRWFKFTADQGFSLNGKHRFLRGANVHQDHAGWGDAVTNTGIYRDVKLIKDCGMDFIRGSHYPHSPYFAESCDKLGVLLWSELPYWGSTMGPESGKNWKASAYPPNSANWKNFEDNLKQQLKEMIRINRNHPSIITWSMGNEVFFCDSSVLQRAKDFVKTLVSISHTEDPTRPAGMGGVQRQGFDVLTDLAGYNGDGAKLYINPGIPNLVAEYGSYTSFRPGTYVPTFGDCQNVQYSWRSGQAIWCGFDHGSLAGDMGKMGMIDYFRLPKRTWYWYRNEYLGIAPPTWPTSGTAAALQLTADKTTIQNDGTDDCQLTVKVLNSSGKQISNSPDVKLSIVSGPGQFPTGSSFTLSNTDKLKSMNEGIGAIEFRSYYSGTTVIKASSAGLPDATISITVKGTGNVQPTPTPTQNPTPTPTITPTPTPTPTPGLDTNIALYHPVKVSSEETTNPRNNGNDGSASTRWCASTNKTGEWYQIDLENFYYVYKTKLKFEFAKNYKYKIEMSNDQTNWTTVVDQTNNTSTAQDREDSIKGVQGRFIRIVYTGLPSASYASHFEFEVYGSATQISKTIVGDLNGDESIDAADFALMKKYILGSITDFPVENDLEAGDLNLDGSIDSLDSVVFKRYLLGDISKLPYST